MKKSAVAWIELGVGLTKVVRQAMNQLDVPRNDANLMCFVFIREFRSLPPLVNQHYCTSHSAFLTFNVSHQFGKG